ncbi:MAG: AAA domain-containing protein, partial [Chlorobiaceae bacterium]|nr:AAA domain-containing protein [Chlorobiaceae bacterium]
MQHAAELEELGLKIREASRFIEKSQEQLSRKIIGQQEVVQRIFIALLVNGHILLEGVPGLAKTLIIRTFATAMNLKFQRIQFTPDMLPADLIGTMIYNPKDMEFYPRKGPVFANV